MEIVWKAYLLNVPKIFGISQKMLMKPSKMFAIKSSPMQLRGSAKKLAKSLLQNVTFLKQIGLIKKEAIVLCM